MSRPKIVSKLNYVMNKVTVSKDNIDDYEFYDNRRKIRITQVNALHDVLKKGDTFPPVAINIKDNKKFVLDGNHRFEAVKKYIGVTDNKLEMWEIQFHITDPEEEKNTFVALNNIIKTTSDDLIYLYKDEPFILNLMKTCPAVSIYGSEKKPVKVRPLINAYFLAIRKKHTTDTLTGFELINRIKEGDADIKVIKAFLKDYEFIFGSLTTKCNIWLKTTLLNSMFRLWYMNRHVSQQEMTDRFRLLINHPHVLEFAKMGGREATFMCANKFVEIINARRGKKFILVAPEPQLVEVA